jgi:hypothetical protein
MESSDLFEKVNHRTRPQKINGMSDAGTATRTSVQRTDRRVTARDTRPKPTKSELEIISRQMRRGRFGNRRNFDSAPGQMRVLITTLVRGLALRGANARASHTTVAVL